MIGNLVQKSLSISKKKFVYVKKGKGKLILLVHGWPETWHSWLNQISFLSKLGFKVVAFNVRGYPGSYSPRKISDYAMKYYINDIINIIDFFREKQAILIGHDWGAPICWNTAAYFRNRISAVIGISVPHTRRGKISSTQLWKKEFKDIFFYQNYFQNKSIPEKELEKNAYISLSKIYYWCSAEGHLDNVKSSKILNSGLLDGIPFKKKRLPWLNNSVLKVVAKSFERHGFRGTINRYRAQDLDWAQLKELEYLKIRQPSLFIAGEYDPVRYFLKGYDAYKNAGKFCTNLLGKHIIADAGHWVQQERPKEVNKAINAFLKRIC